VDEDQAPAPGDSAGGEGTAAVLYAIFTSFTESLGGLERRLDAIEAAVREARAEPAGTEEGVPSSQAEAQALVDLVDLVNQRADGLHGRLNELEAALEDLRSLLQAHADEAAHSLGRRAGDMGRRLASDLGLVRRPPPER
jgi:chromosome segregation ATPase